MPARTRAPILAQSLALLALLATGANAAPALPQWQTIAQQAGSTVELDKNRISRLKGGKTAAWSQLTLDHAVLDFEGRLRYTTVQAMNHYDCGNGSYATQQRIYLLEGREVKREKVSGPQMSVQPDSIDAQLLAEACKPRTVGEMQQAAVRAEIAAAAASEARPRPMRAEMVLSLIHI